MNTDIPKYLPESREYFRKFLRARKQEIFNEMREYKVGPGSGYNYFYRSDEVVQLIRDIYFNLEETFGALTIPGEFPNPKALVQTWKQFHVYLESKVELFEDIAKSFPKVGFKPPPFVGILKVFEEVKAVLNEILSMEEVNSYLTKDINPIFEVVPQNATVSNTFDIDIAVITVLDIEFKSIKSLLTDFGVSVNNKFKDLDHATYYKGCLSSHDRTLNVVVTKSPEMGMPAATATAMKMIYHFRPKYLIMTGIAAGIKGKTKIGDVLVGEFLWNSGSGKRVKVKVEEVVNNGDGAYSRFESKYVSKFVPYINQIDLDAFVSSQINSIIDQDLYCQEIKTGYNFSTLKKSAQKSMSHDISIKLGPFASGSSVIANEDIVEELKEQHAKLLGFDMEAYGIFYAAKHSLGPKPVAITIKSVSDFGDSNKNIPNKDAHQSYAAYTSAAFFKNLVLNHLRF